MSVSRARPKEESTVSTCKTCSRIYCQGHWEWQEVRRIDLALVLFKYRTVHGEIGREDGARRGQALNGIGKCVFFSLSLSHRSPLTRGGGHVGREMQEVKGSACSRVVRRSFGSRNAAARAGRSTQYCGNVWPNTDDGKPKKSGRLEGGDLLRRDLLQHACVQVWADNVWPFSDSKEKLVCMV